MKKDIVCSIDEENYYSIGLDIGGTKIASGIISRRGKLLCKEKIFTGAIEGPEAVIDRICGKISKLLKYQYCLGI